MRCDRTSSEYINYGTPGPLIEDLNHLWHTGENVFDAYSEENFTLRALLYGTINDFPACGWKVIQRRTDYTP